jgi:hypothetical protein
MQPFLTGSAGAAVKTLKGRITGKKSFAKDLSHFKYSGGFERELSAMTASTRQGSRSLFDLDRRLDAINEAFFYGVGLEWITKTARNYAYDVGVNRAYQLSKKAKLTKSQRMEAEALGLDRGSLAALSKYDSVEEAFERGNSFNILDRVGAKKADHDAIIPLVGNRLFFTQSRNPYEKSFGQFMAWAQAKSAQMNQLLTRIENGDGKMAVRIIAAIPVYAAVKELKNTLNPYHQEKWEADDDETRFWNKLGDAMIMSGQFSNYALDKIVSTISYHRPGKGLGESLSPVMGLMESLSLGLLDTLQGNPPTARAVIKEVPVLSQAQGYFEKLTEDKEEDKTLQYRLPRYSSGGKVENVPNVPEEPDERIDKLTGRPYNEQAGEAFIDNDDDPLKRMGFGRGGNVEEVDPLQRMGFGTGSMVTATTKEERAEDMSMYRADGSKKSNKGFIGQVKNNVSGGIMTEVSVGVEIQGEEVSIPTMVPTLTTKEIEILSNMKIKGNAKNIPKSIINKAIKHAEKRKAEGKSPFYQDGEDRVIKNKGGKVLSSLQRKH